MSRSKCQMRVIARRLFERFETAFNTRNHYLKVLEYLCLYGK